ncbi:MAG: hypothetical protein QN157_13115 [Armatimonadota bacterium]|nr:hypothetical protein [Armatimonadota bacterium]
MAGRSATTAAGADRWQLMARRRLSGAHRRRWAAGAPRAAIRSTLAGAS